MPTPKHQPDEPCTLAVILGRAGSSGLPGKNSMDLHGRPMVAWTIDHARQAHHVARIVVSTDCPELQKTAALEQVDLVVRPPQLATDTATIDDAARHAIEDYDAQIIVILYANVPIRPPGLIDRAIELLDSSGADSVQSYCTVGKYHPYWEVHIDETARVQPFLENSVYRRQDLPPLFIPDGGVIAVTRQSLLAGSPADPHAFLGRDRRAILNPPGTVIDIDHRTDWHVADRILAQQEPTHGIESSARQVVVA